MITSPNNNNSIRYLKAKICLYISHNKQIDINDFIFQFEGYSPICLLLALSQLTKGLSKKSVKLAASILLIRLFSFD